jgi:hypothetical protein
MVGRVWKKIKETGELKSKPWLVTIGGDIVITWTYAVIFHTGYLHYFQSSFSFPLIYCLLMGIAKCVRNSYFFVSNSYVSFSFQVPSLLPFSFLSLNIFCIQSRQNKRNCLCRWQHLHLSISKGFHTSRGGKRKVNFSIRHHNKTTILIPQQKIFN